jgi:hypothetical protein
LAVRIIPFGPIVPQDLIFGLRYPQYLFFASGVLVALIALCLLCVPRKRKGVVARLGGLTWKRTQFCRGWLITGDTGSGKTSSGINQLAHQVFQAGRRSPGPVSSPRNFRKALAGILARGIFGQVQGGQTEKFWFHALAVAAEL